MDPDRVRAYLQVACAGLGFDIGEIWFTNDDNNGSSSALAAIEEKHEDSHAVTVPDGKRLRFVQLYTSKSFEGRRNMLVKPADEEENYNSIVNASDTDHDDKKEDLEKHVLSPLLVDAISRTAQVVWAHTKKQEGLTGRSDIRLQTAVGMPVAIDGNGNMCVVVMFSPNNIQSTDDAMEYLQSISRSATCSSIPSLLPAFDPNQGLISLPHHRPSNESIPLLSSPCLSDGVETRFVSLDDALAGAESALAVPEVHSDHDLSHAPKDCFGIPMLPSVAELGDPSFANVQGAETSDAFDEASYGVWSTIMDTLDQPSNNSFGGEASSPLQPAGEVTDEPDPVYAMNKPEMPLEQSERLEEFASAFLDVSVFDYAEVWLPVGGQSEYLGQAVAIKNSDSNRSLNEFNKSSEKILIKPWSGAVGRAFSSGNPVWSANRKIFADSGRAHLFSQIKIETALAVPVYSGSKPTVPSFVFCCYSFVRTGSVPFVLKFLQQALRLLWRGLDKVEPHESVGHELWRDVAPADLGEMAADVEMHQHFMIKKRPRADSFQTFQDAEPSLAFHMESLEPPSGIPSVRSIYTGSGTSPPSGPLDDPGHETFDDMRPLNYQTFDDVHHTIRDAFRSIGDMVPIHQHISTNSQGTKRAHVYRPADPTDPIHCMPNSSNAASVPPHNTVAAPQYSSGHTKNTSSLPMPRPLPLPTQVLRQPATFSTSQQHYQQPTHSVQIRELNSSQPFQQGNHTVQIEELSTNESFPQGNHTVEIQELGTNETSYMDTSDQNNAYTNNMDYIEKQQPHQDQQHKQQQLPYQQQQPQSYQPQPQQQQSYQPQQPQPYHPQQQQQQPYEPQHLKHTYQSQQQQQQQPFESQHLKHTYRSQQQQPQMLQPQQQTQMHLPQMQQQPPQTQQPQQYHHSQPPSAVVSQEYDQRQPYSIQQAHSASPPNGVMPVPTSVASIPTNQISASGISFPIPPQPPSVSGMQPNGTVPISSSTNSGESEYCVPTNQGTQYSAAVSVEGKPCRIQGCNEPCVARRPYCVRHSGNRMCEHDGCSKCAQGSTRFCIAHGGGRRCTFAGCDKGARDKFFCAAHGGGKRCKFDGCNKSAVGGSKLCTAHGGGRRCSVEGCDKSAQSSTKFCVKHGGGKKCAQDGCEKVARGRTQYCAAHGGGVRCKLEGCNRVAIGKLQLCRAHGGGARRGRNNSKNKQEEEDSENFDDYDELQEFAGLASV